MKERFVPLVADLLTLLGVRLNSGVDDRRFWKVDSSRIYSCGSAFYALIKCDVHPRAAAASKLWNVKVPSKVKVFAWLLLLGKSNSGCFATEKTVPVDISKLVCTMQER